VWKESKSKEGFIVVSMMVCALLPLQHICTQAQTTLWLKCIVDTTNRELLGTRADTMYARLQHD